MNCCIFIETGKSTTQNSYGVFHHQKTQYLGSGSVGRETFYGKRKIKERKKKGNDYEIVKNMEKRR